MSIVLFVTKMLWQGGDRRVFPETARHAGRRRSLPGAVGADVRYPADSIQQI